MFKRLMVPLDGSPLAELALPYAAELAIHFGSEIILVNVRMPGENPEEPEHRVYLSKMVATVEQNIKNSPELPAGEKVKVAPAIIGEPGLLTHAAEEILTYAEKENVSIIVMATHGRTGIGRWALGSTANKVTRASKCPVLLVRARTGAPGSVHLGKILLPLDGSKQSEAALPYAENLASKIKSQISLLNVVEPLFHINAAYQGTGYYGSAGVVLVPYTEEEMKPLNDAAEKYLKDINDKLASAGLKAGYEVMTGHAGEEIIKAEKERGADIVVMSTHGHSGFGRWDHGSIADKVLHAGGTPLLLVRPKKP